MTAKIYKIYPQYEGITGIKTSKSKIKPVIVRWVKDTPFLIVNRNPK